MDTRLRIYNWFSELVAEEVPSILYVDLWNENVDYAEEESPYELPALFVEFDKIEWGVVKNSAKIGPYSIGKGLLRLHLVTDCNDGGYEKSFSILEELLQAIANNKSENCTCYYPSASYTNHSHMELLENIEELRVEYVREY